jgi:thioredoxin-like negative regulator of GroEL
LPVVEALAEELAGEARFVMVEADRDGEVLAAFDSSSLPTYIVYRDGVEIDRITLGFLDFRLEDRLRGMLEPD